MVPVLGMVHFPAPRRQIANMIKRQYIPTSSGQLHVYEKGEGAALLMLHETPRSGWSYAPLIERLCPRYRCIAPDTLGFGQSDPLPEDASMVSLARNMFELMDKLGVSTADVIGFHTGNKIAAAMAAINPARVRRTVLIGMTHSLIVGRKARNAAIMTVVRRHMGLYPASQDGSHRLRTWAADYAAMAATWFNPALMTAETISDEMLRGQEARMIEMIQCRRSIKQIYQMNFDFDFTASLRQVKVPSLVIECRVPEEAHLGQAGEAVCKLLPDGRLLRLEGAGFDATESHADRIARATTAFLRGR